MILEVIRWYLKYVTVNCRLNKLHISIQIAQSLFIHFRYDLFQPIPTDSQCKPSGHWIKNFTKLRVHRTLLNFYLLLFITSIMQENK